VERPDWDRFPNFKDVEVLECVLGQGEMLFIPIQVSPTLFFFLFLLFRELFSATQRTFCSLAQWWHYVRSLSVSFSVSFWWK
jgi:lysine-specific demethylase 8